MPMPIGPDVNGYQASRCTAFPLGGVADHSYYKRFYQDSGHRRRRCNFTPTPNRR